LSSAGGYGPLLSLAGGSEGGFGLISSPAGGYGPLLSPAGGFGLLLSLAGGFGGVGAALGRAAVARSVSACHRARRASLAARMRIPATMTEAMMRI